MSYFSLSMMKMLPSTEEIKRQVGGHQIKDLEEDQIRWLTMREQVQITACKQDAIDHRGA